MNIDYEKLQAKLKSEILTGRPNRQAAAIAHHYRAAAMVVEQLDRMILAQADAIVSGQDHRELDEAINHAVREIKARHLCDFGIALEWPTA